MAIELVAGTDRTLNCTTNIDIGTPTALKVTVDRLGEQKFQKTIGAGVTLQTTTTFDVRLDNTDTLGLAPGNYGISALITTGGNDLSGDVGDGVLTIAERAAFS